ncbi:hypothetical protein AURDEDRAFT_139830 [Auricularia subglabra TFB-10046 SS5]|uniref:LysM domain-containing protein n=1 Tax=Auricularia subglabra (strain TFB-10046 / SS5) TaxID=717982 RepID=J0LHJ4_AURST|nr:hypothetical protein AURDEDRAFT_139830 [Auricularia subglabra TFB-10046 SS5]
MITPIRSALVLFAVPGLRAAVVPRDCATIPSSADPATLAAVYNVVLTRNVSDRVLLATFETAWIESHVNALDCGDQDSVGVFQQRPSQGWGTVAQCIDVQYSTTSFLNGAIAADRKYPRYTPGQIAQSVQYSEFPDRYDQAEGIAKGLIAKAQRQAGMPSASSTKAASSTSSIPTFTIPATPSTTTTSSAPAAPTLAPGTLDSTCGALYEAASGDSCASIGRAFDASLAQLLFWNPSLNLNKSLNAACSNIVAGKSYCATSIGS